MAYARKSTRKATRKAPKKKPVRRARASPVRRSSRRAPAKRSGSRARGGGTITLNLVQSQPASVSPLTQMLLDRGKITMPKRARF